MINLTLEATKILVAGAEQRVDRLLSGIYIEVTLDKGGVDVNGQAGEHGRTVCRS